MQDRIDNKDSLHWANTAARNLAKSHFSEILEHAERLQKRYGSQAFKAVLEAYSREIHFALVQRQLGGDLRGRRRQTQYGLRFIPKT